MIFLRGSDHDSYGKLMAEWRMSYANNQDLYPANLANLVDVMRVMPQKRRKFQRTRKNRRMPGDDSPAEETELAHEEQRIHRATAEGTVTTCGLVNRNNRKSWLQIVNSQTRN